MIDVGQSVGNYNITAKLGEGGMGMVYLAEHPVIGRKVALKAIDPQFAGDADVIARFVTEAKCVNQIGHQHIVDVTDFGTTAAGDFYFIMEYLEGGALSDSIKRDVRFPPERALSIAAQIADALQASHEHGVVHRDLKPENIFLIARGGNDDFVKVLDFGIAKLLIHAVSPDAHNTQAGSVMGTPFYMAPEQCEGKSEVDHRVDVYALGVMVFEMLTGKLPFGGEGYGEILLKHMTVAPPTARSIVPELPAALDLILLRALNKDPRHRFQTMAEMRDALLDPDGYASSVPALPVVEDLSGRVRAAMPMSRTEMSLRLHRPTRSQPDKAPAAGRERTTFSDTVGELRSAAEVGEARPKRSRGRAAALAIVAAVAVSAVAGVTYRRGLGRMLVAAGSPGRPATVRLNFSSQPDGATVTRTDGTYLGVTPLSTAVPYGDAAIEYVLRKQGYVSETLAAVPNLAASLFASLQRESPPAPPAPPAESPPVTVTPAPEPAPTMMARSRRHRARAPIRPPAEPDGDEALAPTVLP